MPYRNIPKAMRQLFMAGLSAALLGSSTASAEERITLEVIGAVRMARADEARPVSTEPRSADGMVLRAAPTKRLSRAP